MASSDDLHFKTYRNNKHNQSLVNITNPDSLNTLNKVIKVNKLNNCELKPTNAATPRELGHTEIKGPILPLLSPYAKENFLFRDSEPETDISPGISNISDPVLDLYSMKFAKPRNPVINDFPPLGLSDLELARIWVQRSLGQDPYYDDYIAKKVDSLTLDKREREKQKRIGKKEMSEINLLDNQPQTLSYISLHINQSELPVLALIDTGASRNLCTISITRLHNVTITPRTVLLRTANGVSRDLIKGTCCLNIKFTDYSGATWSKILPFLVATSLNNHQMILGSPLLRNSIIAGPTFILPHLDELHCIPLFHKSKANETNNIAVSLYDITIEPQTAHSLHCSIFRQIDFIALQANNFDSNNKSDLEDTPTPPTDCLGLFYKMDEKLKQTNIPQLNQIDIVDNKIIIPIKNTGSIPLHIAKNQPLGGLLTAESHLSANNFLSSALHRLITPDFQSPPVNNKTQSSIIPPPFSPSSLTDMTEQHKLKNPITDLYASHFQGTNHSQVETSDDLLQQESFVPLQEFTKIHKLSDIDYSNCPETFLDKAKNLVDKYPDCFSKHKLDVGNCSERNDIYMSLQTIKDKVSCDKKRPLSGIHLEYAEKVVAHYVKAGLMTESYDSPFRSNLNIVRKKTESTESFAKAGLSRLEDTRKLRLVFDVRSLNQITKVKTPSSLPTIDSVHRKLNKKYVIVSDLNNAFSHLRIKPSDCHKTSFYLNHKVYKCLMVVQGLTNSPYICTKFTSIVFSQNRFNIALTKLSEKDRLRISSFIIDDILEIYMDDVFLFHEDPEILLIIYEAFLIMCRLGDVKMAPSKTSILTTKLNILGIFINTMDGELSLDQAKIKALIEIDRPNSLYALHSRLAQFLYIIKYLPLLQFFLFPLSLMLKTKTFIWTEIEEQAWQSLLLLIKLNVKLAIPDKEENLLITCDASRYALGAALFVDRSDGLCLAQVTSKINSINNFHKSSYILELQALHLSLATFWPYLINCRKKIYIFSDMRAILFLKRMSSHSLLVQNLLDNITFRLQQLDVVLSHAPGSILLMADTLSRSFESYFKKQSVHPLSKIQAAKLPPVPQNCTLTSEDILQYLTRRPKEEKGDIWQKDKRHSAPPKIDDLFKELKLPSPEERYLTVLKLLAGHDTEDLNRIHTENIGFSFTSDNVETVFLNELISQSNKDLSAIYMDRLNFLLNNHFPELQKSPLLTRLRRSLDETYRVLIREQHNDSEDLTQILKEKFTTVNAILSDIHESIVPCPTPASSSSTPLSAPSSGLRQSAEAQTLEIVKSYFFDFKDKYYDRPSHLKIWTHGPGLDIKIADHVISIPINRSMVLDPGLPQEEPLDFFIEVMNGFSVLLYFTPPHPSLDISVIDQNFKNMTTMVTILNNSPEPIQLLENALIIHIEMFQGKNNGPLHFDSLDLQMINIFDLSPLYILDKISSPTVVYSHVLRTNHHLSAPSENTPDDPAQLNEIRPLDGDHVPAAADITEPSPEIENSSEDYRLQQLIIERDVRMAGQLTKSKLAELQSTDPFCQNIGKQLPNLKNFSMNKQLLIKHSRDGHDQIVIPAIIQMSLLRNLHESYHHPSMKDLKAIVTPYYFLPRVECLIKRISQSCYLCTILKASRLTKASSTPVTRQIDQFSTRARQSISLDIIYLEADQYPYALVIQDIYSGFLTIQPLRNKTSAMVCDSLLEYFAKTDFPDAILSDQGTEFGLDVQALFAKYNILHFQSYAYSQWQNKVESSMKILKQALRLAISDLRGSGLIHLWQKYCHLAISHINTRKLKIINMSRHGLFFGSEPNSSYSIYSELFSKDALIHKMSEFLLARDFLITKARNMKLLQLNEKTDSKNVNPYKLGDIVFLKQQKHNTLKDIYEGPYIIRSVQPQGVQVQDLRTDKLRHSHQRYLRPFTPSDYEMNFPKDLIKRSSAALQRLRTSGDSVITPDLLSDESPIGPTTRSMTKNSLIPECSEHLTFVMDTSPLPVASNSITPQNSPFLCNKTHSYLHKHKDSLSFQRAPFSSFVSQARGSRHPLEPQTSRNPNEGNRLGAIPISTQVDTNNRIKKASLFNINNIENVKNLKTNEDWRIPPSPSKIRVTFSLPPLSPVQPVPVSPEITTTPNNPFLPHVTKIPHRGISEKHVSFEKVLVQYF